MNNLKQIGLTLMLGAGLAALLGNTANTVNAFYHPPKPANSAVEKTSPQTDSVVADNPSFNDSKSTPGSTGGCSNCCACCNACSLASKK